MMMMMMPIQQKSMEEVQTVTIILRDDSALFTSGLKESCNCQKKTVADLGTFTLLQPW